MSFWPNLLPAPEKIITSIFVAFVITAHSRKLSDSEVKLFFLFFFSLSVFSLREVQNLNIWVDKRKAKNKKIKSFFPLKIDLTSNELNYLKKSRKFRLRNLSVFNVPLFINLNSFWIFSFGWWAEVVYKWYYVLPNILGVRCTPVPSQIENFHSPHVRFSPVIQQWLPVARKICGKDCIVLEMLAKLYSMSVLQMMENILFFFEMVEKKRGVSRVNIFITGLSTDEFCFHCYRYQISKLVILDYSLVGQVVNVGKIRRSGYNWASKWRTHMPFSIIILVILWAKRAETIGIEVFFYS